MGRNVGDGIPISPVAKAPKDANAMVEALTEERGEDMMMYCMVRRWVVSGAQNLVEIY